MAKKKRGYYSISSVSDVLGIHQQTIRMYEREGLITPMRSKGNTRMFSEEDIEQLEQVINYTTRLGVNIAGVQIILKMQKKIGKLQNEINRAFEKSRNDLEKVKNNYIYESNTIGEELKKLHMNKKGSLHSSPQHTGREEKTYEQKRKKN